MESTVAVAPTGLNFSAVIERITHDLEQQFKKTVDGLEGITVAPTFTPESRAAVTRDFTEAIDLPIKGFTQEQIRELRQMVEKNTLEGGCADRLAAIIEARYGIAKRKAVFLAGQETSLMISAYREHKYKSIGSRNYRWSTSHDERVRHSHRILDGKVFNWDDPPLIQGTTRHCNPGSDFNCRCAALPIIEVAGVSILP
jgi:SPP1 gp7 family putative phage head morphogenesis protein